MSRNLRKITVLLLALTLILTTGVTSFAGSKITEKQAISKALKNAGLSKSKVRALEAEYEDGKYEIEFVRKSNKAEYSYEYSKSGRLLEKSIDYRYKKNSSKEKIGKSEARKKAAAYTGVKLSIVKKGSKELHKKEHAELKLVN